MKLTDETYYKLFDSHYGYYEKINQWIDENKDSIKIVNQKSELTYREKFIVLIEYKKYLVDFEETEHE